VQTAYRIAFFAVRVIRLTLKVESKSQIAKSVV
jgi:hypothetical protein